MAGLDTRGFMDGVAQGLGLVYQHQDRQRQQKLDDKRLEMTERQMGLREAQIQQQMKNDQANTDWNAKARQRQESEWQRSDDTRAAKSTYNQVASGGLNSLTSSDWDQLNQINDRNSDLVSPFLKKTIADRQQFASNKEGAQRLNQALTRLMTPGQQLQPDDEQALLSANTDITRAAHPEAINAAKTVQRIFDQRDSLTENDPEALQAVNFIFGDMVGDGKTITGIYPGKTPGTITLDLDTKDQAGVPMTKNRGTAAEGDDEVLEIPLEKAIESLTGFQGLAYQFATDKEARAKVLDFAHRQGLFAVRKPNIKAVGNLKDGLALINMNSGNIINKVEGNYKTALAEKAHQNELDRQNKIEVANIRAGSDGLGMGIDPEAEKRAKAEAYADSRISEMAGLLTTDSRDFAKYGGSREQARQHLIQEYLKIHSGNHSPSSSAASLLEQRFGKR